MHRILDVDPLRSEISGEVVIGDPAGGDDREHISLNCLANPITYLQSGIINLNIHVPQMKSGRADHARFKQLVDMVVPMVDEVSMDDIHYQIQDDKGVIKDRDRDIMYFYNIRIEFQTFKT